MDPSKFGIPALALKAILGFILLALLTFALWFVFLRPASLKTEAVQARGAQVQSEAVAGAAKDTIEILVRNTETVRRIDQQTEASSIAIRNTSGATQVVAPDTHAAGLRALCLRDGRAGDPVCTQLLHRDGSGVGAGQDNAPRSPPR